MSDYLSQYNEYLDIFNQEMQSAIDFLNPLPKVLSEAMEYAISGGGKRIRPVLCFACAKMLGLEIARVKEFAFAIECIHSYSLVHDDLPAMDNDDYRRGKLSTHKKFGEANGILAGDALLNFAFEHCLNKNNFDINDAKALKLLANYAGAFGMIKGQILDLENEKSTSISETILYDIYENKTAKLLTIPLLVASILANNKYYDELKILGYNLGIMFQITDDIMDVEGTIESIGKTPNKDEKEDKLTSIKVFGIDKAKERKEFHYNKCIEQLDKIENSDFLREFITKVYLRTK